MSALGSKKRARKSFLSSQRIIALKMGQKWPFCGNRSKKTRCPRSARTVPFLKGGLGQPVERGEGIPG